MVVIQLKRPLDEVQLFIDWLQSEFADLPVVFGCSYLLDYGFDRRFLRRNHEFPLAD